MVLLDDNVFSLLHASLSDASLQMIMLADFISNFGRCVFHFFEFARINGETDRPINGFPPSPLPSIAVLLETFLVLILIKSMVIISVCLCVYTHVYVYMYMYINVLVHWHICTSVLVVYAF